MGRPKKAISAPKKKVGRPTKRPDLELLRLMYEKYTSEQLAEMYSVPSSTIRSWVCLAKKAGEYK